MSYPGAPQYCPDSGAFFCPDLPFFKNIGSLCEGFMVTVRGHVKPGADRFHINMSIGCEKKCDKAFHLNPRFENEVVVRNSKLGGSWGDESERDGPDFPLKRGEDFEATILVTDKCYKVAFNGKHFCDFKHRTKIERVTDVVIKGAIKLYSVHLRDPRTPMSYPFPRAGGRKNYMDTPYLQPLPNGVVPGMVIRVRGKSERDPKKIRMDFMCQDQEDLAFTFGIRFKEEIVTRNNRIGCWGDNERAQDRFPFKAGRKFEVIFFCDSEKYHVMVDGKNYTTFKYRETALKDIAFFKVHKDVKLFSIEMY